MLQQYWSFHPITGWSDIEEARQPVHHNWVRQWEAWRKDEQSLSRAPVDGEPRPDVDNIRGGPITDGPQRVCDHDFC